MTESFIAEIKEYMTIVRKNPNPIKNPEATKTIFVKKFDSDMYKHLSKLDEWSYAYRLKGQPGLKCHFRQSEWQLIDLSLHPSGATNSYASEVLIDQRFTEEEVREICKRIKRYCLKIDFI